MEKFEKQNIKAIIGLGNPGKKYYKNRHNIGFRIVDEIANNLFASWQATDKMEYAQVCLDKDASMFSCQKVYLIKPQTFMNSSGQVISFLAKKGIKSEEILVVHDELEKKFGYINIRLGGSARGHNGLRSIMGVCGQNFWRLRFGIGRPEDKSEVGNYVLTNFTTEEEGQIDSLIADAVGKVLG